MLQQPERQAGEIYYIPSSDPTQRTTLIINTPCGTCGYVWPLSPVNKVGRCGNCKGRI